jgi:hypothetical protein
MGVTAAVVSATVAVVSYTEAQSAREEQKQAAQQAAAERKDARSVQEAGQAQQAAMERRQQIREERVRRSKIMQSAQNTGTAYSSGETGAVGGLSTQLGTNIGENLGAIQRGQQISTFSQNAANFDLTSNLAGLDAQNAQSLFQLSTSIFASNINKVALPKKEGK